MAGHGENGTGSGGVRAAAETEDDAEAQRVAAVLAGIGRSLEGFDDRLAAVNRRLDLVLERRA